MFSLEDFLLIDFWILILHSDLSIAIFQLLEFLLREREREREGALSACQTVEELKEENVPLVLSKHENGNLQFD